MKKIKLSLLLVVLCLSFSFVKNSPSVKTGELWAGVGMAAEAKGKASQGLNVALLYSSLVTGACAGAVGGPIGMVMGLGFTL